MISSLWTRTQLNGLWILLLFLKVFQSLGLSIYSLDNIIFDDTSDSLFFRWIFIVVDDMTRHRRRTAGADWTLVVDGGHVRRLLFIQKCLGGRHTAVSLVQLRVLC